MQTDALLNLSEDAFPRDFATTRYVYFGVTRRQFVAAFQATVAESHPNSIVMSRVARAATIDDAMQWLPLSIHFRNALDDAIAADTRMVKKAEKQRIDAVEFDARLTSAMTRLQNCTLIYRDTYLSEDLRDLADELRTALAMVTGRIGGTKPSDKPRGRPKNTE